MWTILTWCFILVEMKTIHSPSSLAQNGLTGFALLWTLCSYWIHFHLNILFEVAFGSVVLYCLTLLWKYWDECKNPTARRVCLTYFVSLWTAFAFWVRISQFTLLIPCYSSSTSISVRPCDRLAPNFGGTSTLAVFTAIGTS